jgi:tRNA A-37 threonylcarbamoyl transferase component Bud32
MDTKEYITKTRGPWTLVLRRGYADALIDAGAGDPEELVRKMCSMRAPLPETKIKKGHPNLYSAEAEQLRSGRAAVALVPFDNGRFAVREYRHGGMFRAVVGGLFLSSKRPVGELEALEHARKAGVRVPEPLGAAWRKAGAAYRAYLFTRVVEDACDLVYYLGGIEPPPPDLWRAVVRAAAAEIRKLHDAGVLHGDLHVKNLLVRVNEDTPEVFVIDFDKARVKQSLSAAERELNLLRLGRSVDKLPIPGRVSRADLLRFTRAYLAAGPNLDIDERKLAKRLEIRRRLHMRTRKLPGQKDRL